MPGCNGAETAERSYPASEVRGRDESSCPASKVRGGGREKLPHVQGKEQQLHFAGAAMKRYPTLKVRETQVRW